MKDPELKRWLEKAYGCSSKTIIARSPQSNYCEVAIKGIRTSLMKVGSRDARFGNWLELLDLCVDQMNATPR